MTGNTTNWVLNRVFLLIGMGIFLTQPGAECATGEKGRAAVAQPSGTLPTTLRAAAIDHPGGTDALTPHALTVPIIGLRQVLIAMRAAGVARWDTSVRKVPTASGGTPHYQLDLGSENASDSTALL
jgi:hypothetical protein